jgi:ferric-dicitrate binding protein FerR (iron transport regulator)
MRAFQLKGRVTALLFLLLILLLTGCPPPSSVTPPPPTGREIIGTIETMQGASVTVAGRPARQGMPIYEGEEVKTGTGSTVIIRFSRGGLMQLRENTDPIFTIMQESMCLLIRMFYGHAMLDSGGQCVNGDTPESRAFINTKVDIRVEGGRTVFEVLEGRIEVAAKARPQQRTSVTSGQSVVVSSSMVEPAKPLTQRELQDLNTRFRQIREIRAPAPATGLTPPSDIRITR